MSDPKAGPSQDPHAASPGPAPAAHEHAVNFNSYLLRCAVIFFVILCTTIGMSFISFMHLGEGWTIKVALILTIAVVNAFLVAGYLMHLLSEKKLIYTVLAFTVIFAIGLFVLTIGAMSDFPSGTVSH